jgi:hypothetical protein
MGASPKSMRLHQQIAQRSRAALEGPHTFAVDLDVFELERRARREQLGFYAARRRRESRHHHW